MGDIKIFILLLLSTSCYSKSVDRSNYRNLESYKDENDHELLNDSVEDSVKAVWIDSLIKDFDKGEELIQKEQDRDIFSHHKPSHFNPYSPPTKHYKQPPTIYVKPEPIYQPIDEPDYTKIFKSKESPTITLPHVREEYLNKPEPTTPESYYAQKEFTYDNVGEEYYSPNSFIPPREETVSIEDIKNNHGEKDTLLLVVKVPKLPNFAKHDKIQLPPLTLDLSKDNWSDSLRTIFKNKKKVPIIPPLITIPPPPKRIIKHKEHPITPIDITINYIPKKKEEPEEKWYLGPPPKEDHHYTKPEYLNINHQAPIHVNHQAPIHVNHQAPIHVNHQAPVHVNHQAPSVHVNHQAPAHVNHHASYLNIDEKPILLADPHGQYLDIGEKPILLADPHGQYLDIGEEPMLLVDYPVHQNKYWGRKKRDVSTTDSTDSINTTENNEKSEQNIQKKSTYRGELPPLEFPKMKKYKGIRVEQSPFETDAPLYVPESDDKVLSLVFEKHSNNKKTTTPTKRTVIKAAGTVPSEAYEYDKDDDSFAPLIFPDNVKLVADDDDYKKYIPPTYFPETEADVDYKFEIRPFQQSVYDRLMRRIPPLLTTPAETVEVSTNEKLPTVTTNDKNLIDVPDKIPYDDDDEDEDDNFKEVKPPLYFPETAEELRAFNELYNRGRTSGHRKLKVYQKKKPHIHKE